MKDLKTRTNATFTAANGETVSYDEIFDSIRKSVEVFGKSKGRVLSAQDLEDIFQDSVYKALKYSASYNPAKSQPQTWGSRIARNCYVDAVQRNVKEQKWVSSLTVYDKDGKEIDQDSISEYAADGCYDADSETESHEALNRIEMAIDSLSENYRFILSLQRKGMKPKKMAEEIGCPAGVVYTLLCRARKALKEELGWEFLAEYGIPS